MGKSRPLSTSISAKQIRVFGSSQHAVLVRQSHIIIIIKRGMSNNPYNSMTCHTQLLQCTCDSLEQKSCSSQPIRMDNYLCRNHTVFWHPFFGCLSFIFQEFVWYSDLKPQILMKPELWVMQVITSTFIRVAGVQTTRDLLWLGLVSSPNLHYKVV